ncbi:peptidoglycan-binding domain-containing protein [Aquimarina mytili]|uniref:Peptidoglycan binding-like domain-containing protein n=1 Tax=Aquimarina mytili TaxID=874423 RepID=A0A937D806_9FLAO|nr:peptidoglycan-binding domain-containing protein [Aquimarina mytili]MBL0683605.1 hypothetical protein [Aquimarina mytili]
MKTQALAKRHTKNKTQNKAGAQKKYIIYGLGVAALIGGGYLAYNYLRNRKVTARGTIDPITPPTPRGIVTTPILPVASSGSFPLRRGARGSLVQMVQNALLQKGGQAALIIKETSFRNGKADGIFGRGTERALRAAGFSSAITQSTFTSLVGKNTSSSFGGWGAVAKELIDAANKRNLFGVLNGLKKITSPSQYRRVSTFFKNVKILGIRVTSLVNALLSVAFKSKELEKVKIRAEFRRMGLKQNSRGVWFVPSLGTLGNFDHMSDQIEQEWNLAVVEKPTLLKAEDGSFIVPEIAPNTVVGYITGMQNGMARILTQSGETVYAPTQNLSSM